MSTIDVDALHDPSLYPFSPGPQPPWPARRLKDLVYRIRWAIVMRMFS